MTETYIDNAKLTLPSLQIVGNVQLKIKHDEIGGTEGRLNLHPFNCILENVTLELPDGRKVAFARLQLTSIVARALPILDGDNVVLFRMEDECAPAVVVAAR